MDIISVPGRLVRDPATQRIVDDAGARIDPANPYWVRLLADGDVVEKPEPAPEADAVHEPVAQLASETPSSHEEPA